MKTCTTIVQSLSLQHYCAYRNVLKNAKIDIIIALYISEFTLNIQWPHNNKIPIYRQLPFSISGSSENCITKPRYLFIFHITSNVFRFDMT